jgi:hypothetical protein
MAFANTDGVINNLSGYIEENAFELISKAVLGSKLSNYIDVRVGLQGNAVKIPLLESNFNVTSGAGCGWSDTETTTLTQVPMNIYHAKINAGFCPQTLRQTFMSKMLQSGAMNGNEQLPMEAIYANYFVEKLAAWNENYLIHGATNNGADATYKGFKELIAAATDDVVGTNNFKKWVVGTAGSGEVNALDGAQQMFQDAPSDLMYKDDLILVVGYADYKALVGAMVKANLYHYTGDVQELIIPATNIRVVPSAGIKPGVAVGGQNAAGSNFRFLTAGSNLIMGTDLTSDFEEFKVWYSQDNDQVRSLMRWAIGVTPVETKLIVQENVTVAEA